MVYFCTSHTFHSLPLRLLISEQFYTHALVFVLNDCFRTHLVCIPYPAFTRQSPKANPTISNTSLPITIYKLNSRLSCPSSSFSSPYALHNTSLLDPPVQSHNTSHYRSNDPNHRQPEVQAPPRLLPRPPLRRRRASHRRRRTPSHPHSPQRPALPRPRGYDRDAQSRT